VQLEAKDFSPALLALYVQGLEAGGAGSLVADFRVESGRLGSGTRVELEMASARAGMAGFVYSGAPRLTASLDVTGKEPGVPRIHATVPGAVALPLPQGGHARVDLTGLRADGTLSGSDLVESITLDKLDVRLEEGRVVDARSIGSAVMGSLASFFVHPLLGDGPLVGSAAVDRRKDVTIALLRHASLGLAEMRGAARTSTGGWDGAAAGHIGFLPIGVRLKDSKAKVALFVSDAWLVEELAAAGIRFEGPPSAH
jgi:hypothetical protein